MLQFLASVSLHVIYEIINSHYCMWFSLMFHYIHLCQLQYSCWNLLLVISLYWQVEWCGEVNTFMWFMLLCPINNNIFVWDVYILDKCHMILDITKSLTIFAELSRSHCGEISLLLHLIVRSSFVYCFIGFWLWYSIMFYIHDSCCLYHPWLCFFPLHFHFMSVNFPVFWQVCQWPF